MSMTIAHSLQHFALQALARTQQLSGKCMKSFSKRPSCRLPFCDGRVNRAPRIDLDHRAHAVHQLESRRHMVESYPHAIARDSGAAAAAPPTRRCHSGPVPPRRRLGGSIPQQALRDDVRFSLQQGFRALQTGSLQIRRIGTPNSGDVRPRRPEQFRRNDGRPCARRTASRAICW